MIRVAGQAPSDPLRRSKDDLRARMRAARGAIPAEERERRSEAIAARVLGLPEAALARRVLTFLSFGSEVSTAPILDGFRERGAALAVPILADGRMEAVEFPDGGVLVPSSYGAMEPADRVAVPAEAVDLVVAPGLAFDRSGRRVG